MYFTSRMVPSGLQAFPLYPPNNTDHHGQIVHIVSIKDINFILLYHHKHLHKPLCCSTCPWGKYWTPDFSQCCIMRVWMSLNSFHFWWEPYLLVTCTTNPHSGQADEQSFINAGYLLYFCKSTVIYKTQEVSPSLSCVTVAYSLGLHNVVLLFEQAHKKLFSRHTYGLSTFLKFCHVAK